MFVLILLTRWAGSWKTWSSSWGRTPKVWFYSLRRGPQAHMVSPPPLSRTCAGSPQCNRYMRTNPSSYLTLWKDKQKPSAFSHCQPIISFLGSWFLYSKFRQVSQSHPERAAGCIEYTIEFEANKVPWCHSVWEITLPAYSVGVWLDRIWFIRKKLPRCRHQKNTYDLGSPSFLFKEQAPQMSIVQRKLRG